MRAIADRVVRLPWLWLAPTLAAALAVAFIALGALFSTRSDDLWFELAKTGMQLLAIVVLGGVVTAAFRTLDARREERREEAAEDREEQRKLAAEERADRRLLDEYLGGIAGELIEAYLRIKAVRRKLRAIGLRPPVSGRLSPEQRVDYRAQMDVLVDAQLTLEKVKDDVDNQPPVFEPHGARIWQEIHLAEGYVNEVIKEWEDHNADFQLDNDLSGVISPLGRLQAFLLGAHEHDGLEDKVSTPIAEAARLIHSLRLRVSPAELGGPPRRAA